MDITKYLQENNHYLISTNEFKFTFAIVLRCDYMSKVKTSNFAYLPNDFAEEPTWKQRFQKHVSRNGNGKMIVMTPKKLS